MKINSRLVAAIVALALILPAPAVVAQVLKGSIQGRVTDSTGAVLQGASVTVNPIGMRTATTTEGDFTIAGLLPGAYTVTVDFVGFKEFAQSVTVSAGETTRVNARLDVAGQTEEILVAGSTDYRVNNNSSLALRGLYSTFRKWGQKWVYTLNDGDVPGASIDWRRPDYAVGNLVGSGRHTIADNWLTCDVSYARSFTPWAPRHAYI